MNKLPPVEEELKENHPRQSSVEGTCDYCRQSNVRLIPFPCKIHNYCWNCQEHAPKFQEKNFTCSLCATNNTIQNMKQLVEVFSYKEANGRACRIKYSTCSEDDMSGNNDEAEEKIEKTSSDMSKESSTQNEVQVNGKLNSLEALSDKPRRVTRKKQTSCCCRYRKMTTPEPTGATTFANSVSLENFLKMQRWSRKTMKDYPEYNPSDDQLHPINAFCWSRHNIVAPPPSIASSGSTASICFCLEDLTEPIESPDTDDELESSQEVKQPLKDEFWDY